jgi:hypothetical protein
MYSKDYHVVVRRQTPHVARRRGKLRRGVDMQMLPAGTRQILIRTLSEIQSRLEYLAHSVIETDDPESAAELRSSAGNIERVIERLKAKVDAG